MLRVVVIGLVVANLLLLGLQASKPPVPTEIVTQPVVTENSNLPTIHMFSELKQDEDLINAHRRCFSLGPFHSSGEFAKVRARLAEISVEVRDRQTQATLVRGYWVYMPPYESLSEANQALRSLRAKGLKNLRVTREGKWAKAISLGYFLSQKNALKQKNRLEAMDYSPQMQVRRHSEPRYWLDYEQDPGANLLELDMQNRPGDFMQRPLPCLQDVSSDERADGEAG